MWTSLFGHCLITGSGTLLEGHNWFPSKTILKYYEKLLKFSIYNLYIDLNNILDFGLNWKTGSGSLPEGHIRLSSKNILKYNVKHLKFGK